MHKSLIAFVVDENLRGFRASYDSDGKTPIHSPDNQKTYFFKSFDPSIKKGDLVVVATNTRHGMTVVRIEEVDVEPDYDANIEVKWILSTVKLDAYKAMVEREDYIIEKVQTAEKRRKRKELRASLMDSESEDLAKLTMLGAPPVMSATPSTPPVSKPFPPAYEGLDATPVVEKS